MLGLLFKLFVAATAAEYMNKRQQAKDIREGRSERVSCEDCGRSYVQDKGRQHLCNSCKSKYAVPREDAVSIHNKVGGSYQNYTPEQVKREYESVSKQLESVRGDARRGKERIELETKVRELNTRKNKIVQERHEAEFGF